MDGIKKLANRLANTDPEEEVAKSPRTLMLVHDDFLTLQTYCKRKKVAVGDVISQLISDLVFELIEKGEVTMQDSAKSDEFNSNKAKMKKPPG